MTLTEDMLQDYTVLLNTDLYTGQPRVGEGSGEKGLPHIGFCDVKIYPHW